MNGFIKEACLHLYDNIVDLLSPSIIGIIHMILVCTRLVNIVRFSAKYHGLYDIRV